MMNRVKIKVGTGKYIVTRRFHYELWDEKGPDEPRKIFVFPKNRVLIEE